MLSMKPSRLSVWGRSKFCVTEVSVEVAGARVASKSTRNTATPFYGKRQAAALRLEENRGEGRETEFDGVLAIAPGNGFGLDPAGIAEVGALVILRVGIEDLAIEGGSRNADSIVVAGDRREVANYDDKILRVARAAQEGEDAIRAVVGIKPIEASPFEV